MVLEAHRWKVSTSTLCLLPLNLPCSHRVVIQALDALKENIVDWLGGLPEALTHVEEFKLVQRSQKGMSGMAAYGALKQEMWRETIEYLEQTSEESIRGSAKALQWRWEREERERKVQGWEERVKAKL